MPQQRRRSTVILTPDQFGNFNVDIPMDSIYYEGEKIEVDAVLDSSGNLLCFQPKGDITGLPDFLYPHEVSYAAKKPPAPKSNPGIRATMTKEGTVTGVKEGAIA
jgi:hypothetical protein